MTCSHYVCFWVARTGNKLQHVGQNKKCRSLQMTNKCPSQTEYLENQTLCGEPPCYVSVDEANEKLPYMYLSLYISTYIWLPTASLPRPQQRNNKKRFSACKKMQYLKLDHLYLTKSISDVSRQFTLMDPSSVPSIDYVYTTADYTWCYIW